MVASASGRAIRELGQNFQQMMPATALQTPRPALREQITAAYCWARYEWTGHISDVAEPGAAFMGAEAGDAA